MVHRGTATVPRPDRRAGRRANRPAARSAGIGVALVALLATSGSTGSALQSAIDADLTNHSRALPATTLTLHLRMRSGRNTHHILEASFKGVARALRDAVRVEGGGVPSTKGTL